MCRAQWVLALVALHVGLAHSWDIAVSLGDQLVFYTDGTVTNTVNFISHNLTDLAYDEVHNRMLYVDKQNDKDSICGYNLLSMENDCFIQRNGSNIHSIAYDPVTETLFFTDTNERSLYWISLKPGSNNNVNGNLLIKTNYGAPSYVAVDSCRGYIYWTNPDGDLEKYIMKAQFNGSDRNVVYKWLPIFSLAIDPQTRNVYFFEGCKPCSHEFLMKAGINEGNYVDFHWLRIFFQKHYSEPQELTVLKDYLYWMNDSESTTTIWNLPKNITTDMEPNEVIKFKNKRALSIAANYKIIDQIHGLQDCEPLSSLIPTTTETKNSLNVQQTIQKQQTTETACTTVDELFCVHGIKDSNTSVCKCTPGYIGERCDVSICENYCLQGNCSSNDEGLPKCRCNAGYSGERCEVYACHGYCLNNGDCSLNEKDEPVCQCVGNNEGIRCEAVKNSTFTFTDHQPLQTTQQRDSLV